MRGSISIFPSMYQSTIFGTSVRPLAPPKAVPFQVRPVTSWNGRVAISAHAEALAPFLLVVVDVDPDDHVGAGELQPLHDVQPDAPQAEDDCFRPLLDL